MQIHELNTFRDDLGDGAFAVVDNGTDTGKISVPDLLRPANDNIDALSKRVDNIIAGSAPSAAEVTDARYGANGVTYPSLGDAIRAQIELVNKYADTQIDNLMGSGADFTNNVRPAGWETSNVTATFSDGIMHMDVTAQYGGMKFSASVLANHVIYIYAYLKTDSNKVSVSWNGNYAGMATGSGNYEIVSSVHTFTADTTSKYSILDGRSTGRNTIDVKDVGIIDLTAVFGAGKEPEKAQIDALLKVNAHAVPSVAVGGLALNNFISAGDINTMKSVYSTDPIAQHVTIAPVVNENKNIIDGRLYRADSFTITTDGNAYCCLKFYIYNLTIGNVVTAKSKRSGGNYATMRIDCYDANGQRINKENVTYGDYIQQLILPGTEYVEVNFFACWGVALDPLTSVTFSDVVIESVPTYGKSGNLLYTGEPIVITDEYQKPNKCNYDLWKDFVGADIPGLANYNLYKQQSIAIYNDYVFMLNEGGDGIVLDFNTKDIISQISTTPTAYQHHNSAQFTRIFYDPADEFPLLMTSMCGNQAPELTEYDVAQFYRIQRAGTTFTFTLINTLKTDFITRGVSWGVDNTNNKLYMAGGRTAYSDPDFVCEFFIWDMPTASQILSGTEITVHEADALSYMTYPRFTVQGVFVNGGILYAGRSIENVGQFIHAINVEANRILSEIPLTDYKEVEGVAIYQGAIYISQKNGVDTAATNPAKIYKISFDY